MRKILSYNSIPQKVNYLKYIVNTTRLLLIKGHINWFCFRFSHKLLKKKKFFYITTYALTRKRKKIVIGVYYLFLLLLFNNAQFGIKNVILLRGIGFSFFTNKNLLYANVGYSYNIFFNIPKNVIYKINGKKSNFFKIWGSPKYFVNDILAKIIYSFYPNVYTGKGIFWYKTHKFLLKKIGKIKKL